MVSPTPQEMIGAASVGTTVGFSSDVPAQIASRSSSSLSLGGAVGNVVSDSPGYLGVTGTAARTVSAWINTSVATDQAIIEWDGDGAKYTIRLDETAPLVTTA